MIRVVLDTNILVSALLQPLGPPAQVFELAIGGVIQLCVSGDIYAEYEEVIRRSRFQRSGDVICGVLEAIREKGYWVRPTETVQACTDSDDDVFLRVRAVRRGTIRGDRELKAFPDIMGRNTDHNAEVIIGPVSGSRGMKPKKDSRAAQLKPGPRCLRPMLGVKIG